MDTGSASEAAGVAAVQLAVAAGVIDGTTDMTLTAGAPTSPVFLNVSVTSTCLLTLEVAGVTSHVVALNADAGARTVSARFSRPGATSAPDRVSFAVTAALRAYVPAAVALQVHWNVAL
jgi:hypothetical protein